MCCNVWLKYVVGVALCVFASATTGQSESDTQKLASRLYELRFSILESAAKAGGGKLSDSEREMMGVIAEDIARQLSKTSPLDAVHPRWHKAIQTIRDDLIAALERVASSPQFAVLEAQARTAFISALARALTGSELERILAFYSSPNGARFTEAYQRMAESLAKGMEDQQRQLLRGEQRSLAPIRDEHAFNELLGLFDEFVKIQLAMLDPGPGKDRSGLQAIPMMIMVAVQYRLSEIEEIWQALSDQVRRNVLAYRASELGRKEREALFKAAAEIPKAVDMQSMLERIAPEVRRLGGKWRSLVPE